MGANARTRGGQRDVAMMNILMNPVTARLGKSKTIHGSLKEGKSHFGSAPRDSGLAEGPSVKRSGLFTLCSYYAHEALSAEHTQRCQTALTLSHAATHSHCVQLFYLLTVSAHWCLSL